MAISKCIINDDVNILKEKLYAADGIVLASPSYGIMETARMKNFRVDKIGMYTAYTSSLGGKRAKRRATWYRQTTAMVFRKGLNNETISN